MLQYRASPPPGAPGWLGASRIGGRRCAPGAAGASAAPALMFAEPAAKANCCAAAFTNPGLAPSTIVPSSLIIPLEPPVKLLIQPGLIQLWLRSRTPVSSSIDQSLRTARIHALARRRHGAALGGCAAARCREELPQDHGLPRSVDARRHPQPRFLLSTGGRVVGCFYTAVLKPSTGPGTFSLSVAGFFVRSQASTDIETGWGRRLRLSRSRC